MMKLSHVSRENPRWAEYVAVFREDSVSDRDGNVDKSLSTL